MIDSLRQERGQERMAANNATHRRVNVSTTSRPSSNPPSTLNATASSSAADKALDLAKQHRDKLLAYQSQNAQRTQIIDEVADYETPTSGQSMWSSPVERAAQLKRQQKVLREQEWNAMPEYEKRRQVLSLDIVGGKVVKKMGQVDIQREEHDDGPEETDGNIAAGANDESGGTGGGTFSNNPFLGSLVRPIWRSDEKGKGLDNEDKDKESAPRKSTWRRVQDDYDNNEEWILDGGIYGGRDGERRLGDEEHAQG